MRRYAALAVILGVLAAGCSVGTSADDAATTSDTAEPTTSSSEATTSTSEPTTTTDPTTSSDAACEQADDFLLELDGTEQADGYGTVALDVTCDGDTFTVASNDLIDYEFVQITPNDLQENELAYELPTEPVEADTPGALPLGQIGVAVNGVALFGAFEAPQMGWQDPLEDGLLDFCNGHTAMQGLYHYHARPDCILDDPEAVGTVVGYAYDGYEIVVPTVCADEACTETDVVTSSYQRVDETSTAAFTAWDYVEGSGDLDECNGRTDADGVYRYYATDQFPYLPFCFHGETDRAAGDFDLDATEGPQGGPGGGGPPG